MRDRRAKKMRGDGSEESSLWPCGGDMFDEFADIPSKWGGMDLDGGIDVIGERMRGKRAKNGCSGCVGWKEDVFWRRTERSRRGGIILRLVVLSKLRENGERLGSKRGQGAARRDRSH